MTRNATRPSASNASRPLWKLCLEALTCLLMLSPLIGFAAIKASAQSPTAEPILADCGDHYRQGTITQIGAAKVTAWHVLLDCKTKPRAAYPGNDLAVLELGDPGVCRNAAIGEAVIFVGYPAGEWRDDDDGMQTLFPIMEIDRGQVVVATRDVRSFINETDWVSKESGVANAVKVRSGYSGGPVYSAEDGRVVGMTQAIRADAKDGHPRLMTFLPVESICTRLEGLLQAEADAEAAGLL